MDRNTVNWRGYWPAAPTPFAADGSLDEKALAALMEHYVRAGVHGILVNGSSGEWWAQSDEERRRVADIAVTTIDRRVPVIVGCTGFTAATAVAFARHAESVGADGLLFTPPPYAHPTQAEILEHYSLIDDAVNLPMIAYNWPRGTAVEISLQTASKIADLDHVVAIKNSTPNTDLVLDYIETLSDRVRIFASLISPRGLAILRDLGGDGYIDGGGIGAPFAVPFFENLWSGDIEAARECAFKWAYLTRGWIEPDFGGRFAAPSAQLKAAMKLLDQPGGEVRQPLLPLRDPNSLDRLRAHLQDSGLIA